MKFQSYQFSEGKFNEFGLVLVIVFERNEYVKSHFYKHLLSERLRLLLFIELESYLLSVCFEVD